MGENDCCSLPEDFCCCISLTSGGKLIAGFSMILSLIAIVFLSIYLTSDISEIAKEIATNPQNVETLIEEGSTAAKVCAGIVLILAATLLVSSVILYRGISSKTQTQFVPYMAALGLTIFFLVIISIIQFELEGFFATLTLVMVFIYLFIIIFALYKRLGHGRCDQQTNIRLNEQYSP